MSTPTDASDAVAQTEESPLTAEEEAEFARMHTHDLMTRFYSTFERAVEKGTVDEDYRKRLRRIYDILQNRVDAAL